MAANMRGPKPADPLYWRLNSFLAVSCIGCRNWAGARVQSWIVWHRLDDRITFHDMQRRMVCLRCRTYGPKMDLKE